MKHRSAPWLASLVLLASCAGGPQQQKDAADNWHSVPLPGKKQTQYEAVHHDGRKAVRAHSERAASMWRRKLSVPAPDLHEVSFSWWVQDQPQNASVGDAHREDSAARVMFAFDGNVAALPMRTRALFELAEALTGESPPYATLMYVWDATAPVGSVITNPRSDRIRKIVVDSGTAQLGRWRDHRRHLADDFRLAFGEAPGALTSVALMADSDNTQSTARAWFGDVQFHPDPPGAPQRLLHPPARTRQPATELL